MSAAIVLGILNFLWIAIIIYLVAMLRKLQKRLVKLITIAKCIIISALYDLMILLNGEKNFL